MWSAFLSQGLSAPRLGRFLERVDVLARYAHSIVRLLEMIITSVPRFIHCAALNPIVSFALAVIATYLESAPVVINQLISFVLEAPSFAASVAIAALLSVEPELLASHSTGLEDLISQSGSLHESALHALCQVIAALTPASHRPMIMVSLPKRLFHHSQVLIEAGVAMALH
jgi:hypothetical protein